jgi:hypothetical protein
MTRFCRRAAVFSVELGALFWVGLANAGADGHPLAAQGRARPLVLLGVLMFGFSALVGAKSQRVRADARGIARPQAFVPWPTPARALFAGPLLATGVAQQVSLESPWWGTCLVAAAMAMAAYRHPTWLQRPRGPGRWLPVADREAFCADGANSGAKRSFLDASTREGLACFAASLVGCVALGYAVSRSSTYGAYLVLFDSAVLFAIFGTGLRRDLPPDSVCDLGPMLGRIARELRKTPELRAIAWAHAPEGGADFDEVRLLCVPRRALAGFAGVEIGLLPANGAGGRMDWPELLVRVNDGSPCQRALSEAMPDRRWVPGRRKNEKILWLRPTLPTAAMTAALARRVLSLLPTSKEPCAEPSSSRQSEVVLISASAGNAAAKSAGSGERISNDGTVASPFQAM